MRLRLYFIFCVTAVALAAICDFVGYYPTYGMFSGEGARAPGTHGGGGYYRSGGFHAK